MNSPIVEDIISVALDIEIEKRNKNISGFRYVDDFYFYFNEKSDAEKTLSELRSILREFELEINDLKTEITEAPFQIEPPWIYDLKLYKFRQNALSGDVKSFFAKLFYFKKQFPQDPIIKYGLKVIRSSKAINVKIWDDIELLLYQCMNLESPVFPSKTTAKKSSSLSTGPSVKS